MRSYLCVFQVPEGSIRVQNEAVEGEGVDIDWIPTSQSSQRKRHKVHIIIL